MVVIIRGVIHEISCPRRVFSHTGVHEPARNIGGFFAVAATVECSAAERGKTKPAVESDDGADDWMFDDSTYANDPKTGHRVDQYKREKTPYRDPNALFDSPMDILGYYGGYFSGFYDELQSPHILQSIVGIDGELLLRQRFGLG